MIQVDILGKFDRLKPGRTSINDQQTILVDGQLKIKFKKNIYLFVNVCLLFEEYIIKDCNFEIQSFCF